MPLPPGTRSALYESVAASILLAIPVVAFLVLQGVLGAGPVDDMFIFARYAENLAAGQGLVFNPGERVEGYSSPLWVLILGVVAALRLDVVAAAPWLSALFAVATVILVSWQAWTALPRGARVLALIPGVFLATSPPLLWWGKSGMETAAVTFFLALSVFLLRRELARHTRLTGAGSAFLLAVLARPDALVALPALLAWLIVACRTDRAALRRSLLSFMAPLSLIAVHLAWRLAYYGALRPNTYFAKAGVPDAVRLAAGLPYTRGFLEVYLPPVTLLALHGVLLMVRRSSAHLSVWIFHAAILVSWIAYVTWIGGDHFPMFRFYLPMLPIFAFGLTFLLQDTFDRPSRRATGSVAGCLVLSLIGIGMFHHWVEDRHGGESARGQVRLAEGWAYTGRWMARNFPPDSSIASIVVGAIPYYSRMHTYDLLGLVDRTVATEGKVKATAVIGHQKYHTDYMLRAKPDYIVFNSSGLYDRPLRAIGTDHGYALYDLANDPRTRALYDYRAVRMENGRYIEFLELKAERR